MAEEQLKASQHRKIPAEFPKYAEEKGVFSLLQVGDSKYFNELQN